MIRRKERIIKKNTPTSPKKISDSILFNIALKTTILSGNNSFFKNKNQRNMMTILSIAKLYFCTLITYLTIDLAWILKIARPFYQKNLGYLMAETPKLLPGIIFYLLFSAGLLIFVILPSLDSQSIFKALFLGFFFGFIAYSAYDLTNHATLRNWPLSVTIVDMLWGATVSCLTSGIIFYASRYISIK